MSVYAYSSTCLLTYGDKGTFSFTTPKNITTAITTVMSSQDDATYYNLQGQTVSNPVKGQLYIIKGKKVIK